MQSEVLLLVLSGALLHAAWNALIRASADKFAQMVALTIGSAVTAAFVLPFLPLPLASSWSYLAASVVSHFVYFVLVARAYEHGDLSVVYPMMRGAAPLLTALVSMAFLGEYLTGAGWLALLLLSGGVLALSIEPRGSAGRGGVVFALANAAVIAAYTVIDGTGARLAGNALSYTLWMFLFNAIPFLAWVFLLRQRRRHLPALVGAWRRGLVGGALALVSYSLAIWAMTRAPIALVAALRETSVIFGALIGVLVLKERFGALRWAATGAILLGAAALRLA